MNQLCINVQKNNSLPIDENNPRPYSAVIAHSWSLALVTGSQKGFGKALLKARVRGGGRSQGM